MGEMSGQSINSKPHCAGAVINMKKQIEIIEKATKTIEVEVPSFYNEHGVRVSITDHSIIKVWPDNTLVSFIPANNKDRYSSEIAEMFRYTFKPTEITKEEFDLAFNNTIKCLTEQYQLSMSMILDPKEQTAAEGQEAALESASQDNAMEVSAEEGGTEG